MDKPLEPFTTTVDLKCSEFCTRVVVPAYHAGNTLRVCLEAIINSRNVANLEIVVADNGGNKNDDYPQFKQYPVKRVLCQEVASAAYTRNYGAAKFKNGVLVFIDADVEIEKDTIVNLIDPIQKGDAEATLGNYTSTNIEDLNFFQQYKQLYISKVYDRNNGFIENDFWTAICAVRADVFHQIGGFDSSYKGSGGEDTEFGIRLSQKKLRILSLPNAKGKHLRYFDALELIKNDLRKGISTMLLYLERGRSFSNHRHAKQGDIIAVFLSVNVALITLIIILFGKLFDYKIIGFLWSLVLLSYFVVRSELISVFLKRKLVFVAKAIPVMYTLDVIRALSVIIAIGIFLFPKLDSKHSSRSSSQKMENNKTRTEF